jgi:isoaspartyl peptidase/L-asparaginase-like protein (Ntn-hydrolase superfamily)
VLSASFGSPTISARMGAVASYAVNKRAVARARKLIESRQYVLDSEWGDVQPSAAEQNAYLESHSWEEYAEWHLGLTEGAADETKARYAFVYGDFRRLHRMGLIACQYRAAEWRHKEIELAAHDLLQLLDSTAS